MGLAKIQAALARISVDPAWRDRFYRDPIAVGAEVGLSADEARDLTGIDRRQVEAFAGSLRRKRKGQVRRTVPIAARALGDRYGLLFDQYADEAPPRGSRADLDDALGFVKALARFSDRDRPAWVVDLARYELTRHEAARSGIRPVVRCFRFPIGWLFAARDPAEVSPAPTLAVWWRLAPRGRLHHLLVTLPIGRRRPIG